MADHEASAASLSAASVSGWESGYCKAGHALTPDNVYTVERTYKSGNKGTLRQCRMCRLDGQRKYRKRGFTEPIGPYDPLIHDFCMDCGPIPRRQNQGRHESLYCRSCQRKRAARQDRREADARAGGYL